ncbi:hypothetical protein HUO13_12050 [Saccharopolyspora erythraea]|uniref:hypothetical protein n=1 Tax=Saccharopolyspora erythraea TaxID=1836 RepID=UPI001BA7A12E|nr:hypothetical protein [Saccharopolyspora erythraea]QUH01445.1 hypothetical protein HUO13_12050 [Saccharopolyspora erythraea]
MPTLKQTAVSPVDPWAVQEKISTSDARYALASTLMPASDSSFIEYVSGVMASGDGGDTHMAAKVQPAGGMNVTVEPANIVINTENSGPYMGVVYEQETLTLAPASSSANRMDVVIARIHDDLNPALGSPAGERKLTIELWTGDDVTGVPATPTLPVSAGWHPLAYITVNSGTTTITEAMIRDARGPGLVTRGGIRPFYGADASTAGAHFSAPGAYPGEQRWMHTNGFQHQIFYGDNGDPARSGWRGVNNMLVYNANSQRDPNSWVRGWQTLATITSITIPYPGTPFMVEPTGRVAAEISIDCAIEFGIAVGSAGGKRINWSRVSTSRDGLSHDPNLDTSWSVTIPGVVYGPFYDTTTIVLYSYNWAVNGSALRGWSHGGVPANHTLLQVKVTPSTVQPPNDSTNDGSGDDLPDKTPSGP